MYALEADLYAFDIIMRHLKFILIILQHLLVLTGNLIQHSSNKAHYPFIITLLPSSMQQIHQYKHKDKQKHTHTHTHTLTRLST